MATEINLVIKNMSAGLRVRLDETLEPAGSFRSMRNSRITERGGIAKRQGISVIGDYDSSGNAIKGLFTYEKADGTKILVKAKGALHQYFDTTWKNFETGLTASTVGYASHVVSTEQDDFLYFSSRDNGYKRWIGYFDNTTTTLSGGETEIPVTTVLKTDVYHSDTSSASSTTTLDIANADWASDQWDTFYVRITSGGKSGKVSKISATTTTQITFATISGLTGTPTFEIRQVALPSSGKILVNGVKIAYTGIANEDSLTVGSAAASASGSAVVLVPTEYPGAPKGDALDVWLTKIIVANIKSAMAKDSIGGNIATAVSRAVYVSKSGNGTDFSFSAPRSADEGDIVELAYGGGRVLDVIAQEETVYAGTPNYIEEFFYTQIEDVSGNTDILQRKPLKPGIGLTGKFMRGKDDIYFFTPGGEFTSIGRVANVDSDPKSLDAGFPIRRLLVDRVNDEAVGLEWRNRLHIAHKLNSNSEFNDRMLIYNRGTNSFEGDWLLPASHLTIINDKPAFGTANGGNVMQMYTGEKDVWDGVGYAISSEVTSNWINITPSGMEDQSVIGMHVAGHIRGNSKAEYYLYADFSDTPVLTIKFAGTEIDFLYSSNISASLGEIPLGEEPLASIDNADTEGFSRFRFTVWFPDIYTNYISWGWKSSGKDEYIETNQVGLTVSADPLTIGPGLVKA